MLLVDACHLLGDVTLAEALYAALLPRASEFYFLGPVGGYVEPPYSRQLGLLAETLGRLDLAVDHLTDAEVRTAQANMRAHLSRVRYELAGALLLRNTPGDRERALALLDQARTLAEELGQVGLLPRLGERRAIVAALTPSDTDHEQQRPTHARVEASNDTANVADRETRLAMRHEGDTWALVWHGHTLRLRDTVGLQVLDQLVASPGQEFHVLQLVSSGGEAGEVSDRGDAGTVLDAEAVQSYRRRLLDLREELEEAEGFADAGRADRAKNEIDFLTQQLASAVGLGGRDRRVGAAAERARTTVQKRLRSAIRRIDDELPALATHLDQAIRTGTFCGYLPDGRPRARRL